MARRDFKFINEAILLLPPEMRRVAKKIFGLRFEEVPPYEDLIRAIKLQIAMNTPLDENF